MSNNFESSSNKEGEIVKVEKEPSDFVKPKNKPEVITQEDLRDRVEDFKKKKKETQKKLNKIRADLGLPETEEATFDIADAEKKLQILAETNNLSLEEAGFEMVDKRDSSNISQQPDATSKIKPEVKDTENKETKPEGELEEKPSKLEPGDEIFSGGNFYYIHDIHTPSAEEEEKIWAENKPQRDREFQDMAKNIPYKEGSDRVFEERKLFDEKKRQELKEHGKRITAIMKGSELTIELDERNIIKVETPEQREKIVKMQKGEDAAETRAANFMGLGATKKFVDKVGGQPGKF